MLASSRSFARLCQGSRSAAAAARRCLATTAPVFSSPIVELREYKLIPAKAVEYLNATKQAAAVRHEHVPTRLCSMPETGGSLGTLPVARHVLSLCRAGRDCCTGHQAHTARHCISARRGVCHLGCGCVTSGSGTRMSHSACKRLDLVPTYLYAFINARDFRTLLQLRRRSRRARLEACRHAQGLALG